MCVSQVVGCGNNDAGLADRPPSAAGEARQRQVDEAATRRLAGVNAAGRSDRGDAVAMLGNRTVTLEELQPILIEAAGAVALSEWAMDRQLDRSLEREGVRVTEADIDRERRLLLEQFSDDADEATRLLDRVREQRGLGQARFRLLLKRNAGLRKLIADRVQITEPMVEQAYAQRYGPRTVARLILVETAGEAQRVRRRLEEGESFIDLAVERSIDGSGDRGGLLPEISADDPTFPAAIREAVAKLEVGEVSDPVAVDGGFAILRAERQIPADDSVVLEAVAEDLRRELRLRQERAAMQQRARMLLEDAELSVLDTQLERAWQRQRRDILEQR